MRDELLEMIRNYETPRRRPAELVSPVGLARMQVVIERNRAHYSMEEEAEFLKELDRYTREICGNKEEKT